MMKKVILIYTLLMLGCSNSNSSGDDTLQEPVDGVSVAANDSANTIEDTELILSDLLTNDTVLDNARITSFDEESTKGGQIEDNRDGSYTYTPPEDFVGEDTFTYTLCDRDDIPDCDTATVTITVEDAGSPVANNDNINAVKNREIIIKTLLDNDDITDEAIIAAIDNTGTEGEAVLNEDKTVTYTPKADFIGTDSFVYSLCDDDEPTKTCVEATVTVTVLTPIPFNIPSELADYYSETIFAEDSELMLEAITELTQSKHTTILSYGQRHEYLYNADADLSNTNNVILMYSGERRYWEEYTSGNNSYSPQTFNTEHVYPQSLLVASDAVTDLHHLRACDAGVNSNRSNNVFTDGSGSFGLQSGNWYPGDEWKGDVARMVMYLNIRYGEAFNKLGGLELFLKWNVEDPASAFEIQRNNVIEGAQGNRNPFIDNPYLATLIWGGNAAENTWD